MQTKDFKVNQFIEYMGAVAQIETIDDDGDMMYVFDHHAYNGGWIHDVSKQSPLNLRMVNHDA